MAKLITALDVPTAELALQRVDQLRPAVDFFKIGLELYCAAGAPVVRAVAERGCNIFLDLKLHDIPRTVANAVKTAAIPGVDLLSIHAQGGRAMISAAAEAAHSLPHHPKILAITILTSLEQADLSMMGVTRQIEAQTAALAMMAVGAGADGVVCSPREVATLKSILPEGTLLVTPGVRPAGASLGDQKRVATPGDAVRNGSTHLVVGRPILQAEDPVAAAKAILAEMNA